MQASEMNMTPMKQPQLSQLDTKLSDENPIELPTQEPKMKETKSEPSIEDRQDNLTIKDEKKSKLEELLSQFGKPDNELKDAQESRRQQLALADILEGVAMASTAHATQGRKTYQELSPDAFKGLRQQAQLRVDEVSERRKAKQEEISQRQGIIQSAQQELNFHREEEKNDSNSDASKMYRDVISAAMPELKIPPNISAANLEKLIGPLQNAANLKIAMEQKKEIARINAEIKNDAQEDKNRKFQETQAMKYQDSVLKNPLFKDNIGVINNMDQVRDLMSDAYLKGGQSVAALGTRMAKAMGEVGVLTERDVTRYITSPALKDSILSGGKKAVVGKITKQDYDNMLRVTNIMNMRAQQKINKAYEETATKFSRNAKIPYEEAMLLINPSYKTKEQLAEDLAQEIDVPIEEAMTIVNDSGKKKSIQSVDSKTSTTEKQTTKSNNKTIVGKQYSPSRNQTKIIYSDGSEDIVNGQQ
jgi:hypothetical protein